MNKEIAKDGIFLAHDELGNAITIEWEMIAGQTERLSEKIKSLAEVLVPTYTNIEVEFAQQRPEAVPTDFMLKPLAPLLQGADIDWQAFEQKTKQILEQFFATMDWAKHSGAQDSNIFVVIKDPATEKQLGAIQFFITPEFDVDTVKAALYGIVPSAQNSGLEKLLMSSIFKIVPQVKRIFLHTRATNEQAIQAYSAWGFVSFPGKLVNWIDMEYLAESTQILQQYAEKLIV